MMTASIVSSSRMSPMSATTGTPGTRTENAWARDASRSHRARSSNSGRSTTLRTRFGPQ